MASYSEIQKFDIADVWSTPGEWKVLQPDFENINPQEGVYRIILLTQTENTPPFGVGKEKITMNLEPNTCLSVGKSRNLRKRLLNQHFSANHSGNRLGRHLAVLFPEYAKKTDSKQKKYVDKDGCKSLISNPKPKIRIEFLYVSEWWKRDLLESYGKALHKCIFDLGIEH